LLVAGARIRITAPSVKADPVAFRLQHLSDARIIDVVKAAAQAAKWEHRTSSAKAGAGRKGTVTGRGIGLRTTKTIAAQE
jgi:nicotinate dehydrogenase subunit B